MCNNLTPMTERPAQPPSWEGLPRWVDGPRPCAVLVRNEGSLAETSQEVALLFDGHTYRLPESLDADERGALRNTLRHALLDGERDLQETTPTVDGGITVHLFR